MIAQGISISKYDKSRWVVNTPGGRNILVNDSTAKLIEILMQTSTFEDARMQFNTRFEADLGDADFIEFTKSKLQGFNILDGDDSVYTKKKYLWLQIQLFSNSIAGAIANPIKYLYSEMLFWPILALTTLFSTYFTAQYFSFSTVISHETNYILFLILVYCSMFIHEFGHIAACRQYRVKHGGVGFGFYFTFPVLYADITNVWTLTKWKRIICNLGGIYNEMIYSLVLGVLFLITQEKAFLFASSTVFIKTLTELNPFARLDGYWILSDLTSIPNLIQNSNDYLKELISFKSEISLWKGKGHITGRNLFLFLYGFINTTFIFIYGAIIIVAYSRTLVNFPLIIWELANKTMRLSITMQDFTVEFFLVFSFYFLMIRFLIIYFLKKKKSRLSVKPDGQ